MFPLLLLVGGLLLACRPDGGDSCEGSGPCDTGLPVDSDDTDAIDTDTDFDTDTDSDTDTDTDSDTDTDTDSDTDTDADADSDTDTGSDTDTEEPWVLSCDTGVVPDEPCTVAADGSGTYTTIQDAVDAASEGDVITVCPGVYDAVSIDTVGLTLDGYGPDSTCIIGTAGTGLTIGSVDVDVSGFTISGEGADPGAMEVNNATGTIHELRIAGVKPGAAGIRFASIMGYSDLAVEDVTFEHNEVDYGLAIFGGSNTVRHSVFDANVVALSVNFAYGYGGSVEIQNCIFTGNEFGLYMSVDGVEVDGVVANNVFYDNISGFATVESGDAVDKRNNVALSNYGGFEGGFYRTDYNVAWGNLYWDFGGTMGTHDAVTDPLFEDAANGDFRLQSTSPLIDAGDPDTGYDDADGTRNDIGAFGGPYGDWTP